METRRIPPVALLIVTLMAPACLAVPTMAIDAGTVSITKVADGGGQTEFPFVGDLGPFSLKDGETLTLTKRPGSYAISEDLPAGWRMAWVGVQTDDGADTTYWDQLGGTVVLDVDVSEVMDILVRNEPTPGIPAPGAIALGGIGLGLVGWLRWRRTL